MFNYKELGIVLLSTIVLGFVVSFSKEITFQAFLYATLFVLIVILINLIAKKGAAYYFDSEIETKIWSIKRLGFKPDAHFSKPLPVGLIIPIGLVVMTLGGLKWLAATVFEVRPKVYRAAKRHGLYSFSEMTEYHIGLIAAAGVVLNLITSVIFYFVGWVDLSRLSIYYAFFNMIPLDELDGNKILFGSLILWSFLAAVTLIAVGYAILL